MLSVAPRPNASARWTIVPNVTLHWKIWEDNFLVFNSASGQTHLLDPLPALILRQIDEGSTDSEDLFCRIAKILDVNLSAELRSTFDETLRRLDDLGLIQPAA